MLKHTKLTVILFSLVLSVCTVFPGVSAEEYYHAVITAVVDGDTVKIRFTEAIPGECAGEERVRLIGVNTPELTTKPPEYFAQEARDYTNRFWRSPVLIRFDEVSARRDVYGRLLAYVYISNLSGDNLLNLMLIENGYGRYYGNFDFEPSFMRDFLSAEIKAKTNKRGLWNNE
jgi:endonuclease YncB( thermonuclease family)